MMSQNVENYELEPNIKLKKSAAFNLDLWSYYCFNCLIRIFRMLIFTLGLKASSIYGAKSGRERKSSKENYF